MPWHSRIGGLVGILVLSVSMGWAGALDAERAYRMIKVAAAEGHVSTEAMELATADYQSWLRLQRTIAQAERAGHSTVESRAQLDDLSARLVMQANREAMKGGGHAPTSP